MTPTFLDKTFEWANRLFLLALLCIVLYPLLYVVSASISDPVAVNSGAMWLFPRGITFEGFWRVFDNRDIWIGYRNTFVYTAAGTLINLLITLPCAYALARRDMAGRHFVMGLLLFTMFFNGGLIPTYLLVKQLGLVDSFWILLLINAASVWNIIVTRTFFHSAVPRELEEAAEIDGCSNFRRFVSIALPLSLPIVAVMALFYGVGHWNQYFTAMIYLSDRHLFPLQLILREILVMNEMSAMMMDGSDMEAMAEQARIADIVKYAVMIVSALPLLVVYPFVQRLFVKGVLIGSLKG
ncbi:carbohydrate ABC transporter permease [Paenibacillus cymbidii]|uniref:carbohydrate ABC transporter permease n=1 Tax=Paenibacillus cymbidii TaxID=1639034 RepID=UPI001080D85A|nr:carbohydrate ABC transporter permease [Paenibacillus cymbidii]